MEISGIGLKEWWEKAPHGAFGKAVREKLDPKWGCDAVVSEERMWEVRVDYRYSGYGETYIKVKARDEEEAKEKALEEFNLHDESDFFDAELDQLKAHSVKTIAK